MLDHLRLSSSASLSGRLNDAGGRTLVEAWRASGLSGAAFCRANDLRPQRLHYWRERLGYPIKVLAARGAGVAPPAAASESPSGFVQVVVDDSRTTDHVDIVIGGALVRVQRGFDPTLLRSVIEALQARE